MHSVLRRGYGRLCRLSTAVWDRVKTWHKDPYGVDRDWDAFEEMSDDTLRLEFHSLLDLNRLKSIKVHDRNRFRRICQFIALRWVMSNEKES